MTAVGFILTSEKTLRLRDNHTGIAKRRVNPERKREKNRGKAIVFRFCSSSFYPFLLTPLPSFHLLITLEHQLEAFPGRYTLGRGHCILYFHELHCAFKTVTVPIAWVQFNSSKKTEGKLREKQDKIPETTAVVMRGLGESNEPSVMFISLLIF